MHTAHLSVLSPSFALDDPQSTTICNAPRKHRVSHHLVLKLLSRTVAKAGVTLACRSGQWPLSRLADEPVVERTPLN